MPRLGGVACSPCFLRKYSGVQPAGAGPEPLMPCSCLPSHRIAKASLPRTLLTGSQIVMAAAAAMAASTSLPPFHSMRRPACAASGCEVDTALRAKTGMRVVGYGLWKSKFLFISPSLHGELLLGDDLLPFRAVLVDHGGELLRRAARALDAELRERHLHVLVLQRLVAGGVEAMDNVR